MKKPKIAQCPVCKRGDIWQEAMQRARFVYAGQAVTDATEVIDYIKAEVASLLDGADKRVRLASFAHECIRNSGGEGGGAVTVKCGCCGKGIPADDYNVHLWEIHRIGKPQIVTVEMQDAATNPDDMQCGGVSYVGIRKPNNELSTTPAERGERSE